MSQPSIESEFITPGALLRATRVKQNRDLADIADETKISLKNLTAMEADDFSALPAEAYSRGFYRLYAETLSLSPEELVKKYCEEKAKWPSLTGPLYERPKALTNQVSELAQRSTGATLTYIGVIIFVILLFGAFLSWYFSWNPATYISEKLRGIQNVEQMEHAQETDPQSIFTEPTFESAQDAPAPGDNPSQIIIPDTQFFLR